MDARKLRLIMFLGLVAIALLVGLSLLSSLPSVFEVAARDLPAMEVAAKEAGIALTWDEFHKANQTPTGRDLAPVIREWREPFPDASDYDSSSPSVLSQRMERIWMSYRSELEAVAKFSDYDRMSCASSRDYDDPARSTTGMSDIHAIFFLAVGVLAADRHGNGEDALRLLESGYKTIELIEQEPTILCVLHVVLLRSVLDETATTIAHNRKSEKDFLSRLIKVLNRHRPRVGIEDVIRAEMIEALRWFAWVDAQPYNVRREVLLNRYKGYEKPPVSDIKNRAVAEWNEAYSEKLARDPFTWKGKSARYLDQSLLLLQQLKTGAGKPVPRIVQDWYDDAMKDADEVDTSLEVSFRILKGAEESVRRQMPEHAKSEAAVKALLAP